MLFRRHNRRFWLNLNNTEVGKYWGGQSQFCRGGCREWTENCQSYAYNFVLNWGQHLTLMPEVICMTLTPDTFNPARHVLDMCTAMWQTWDQYQLIRHPKTSPFWPFPRLSNSNRSRVREFYVKIMPIPGLVWRKSAAGPSPLRWAQKIVKNDVSYMGSYISFLADN